MASFSNLLAPARSVSQQVPLSKVGTQPISRLAPIPAPRPAPIPAPRPGPFKPTPLVPDKTITIRPGAPGYVPPRPAPGPAPIVQPPMPTPPVQPPAGGTGKGMPSQPGNDIMNQPVYRGGVGLGNPPSDQGVLMPDSLAISGVVGRSGGYDPAYQDFLKQNPNWVQQNSQNGILSPQQAYGAWQNQNNSGQSMMGPSLSPGGGGSIPFQTQPMDKPVYTGGIGLGNPPSITGNPLSAPFQSPPLPDLTVRSGMGQVTGEYDPDYQAFLKQNPNWTQQNYGNGTAFAPYTAWQNQNNPGRLMFPSLSPGSGGGILSSNTNMNNGFISSNYSQPSNNMYGTNTNTNSTGKGMSSNNQPTGGTGKSM